MPLSWKPRRHDDDDDSRKRQHRPHYRSGWIDEQLQLNTVVTRMLLRQERQLPQSEAAAKPAVKEIKVIQSFQGEAISLHRLLDTLATTACNEDDATLSSNSNQEVQRLALVGFAIDGIYAAKLAKVLTTRRRCRSTTITSLQLCNLLPAGLDALLDYHDDKNDDTSNPSNPFQGLQELRLTLDAATLSSQQTVRLLQALKQCTTLQTLKLYRLNLTNTSNRKVEETSMMQEALVDLVRNHPTLVDLTLTACRLDSDMGLAMGQAIRESNRLERLDWSMNQIQDVRVLTTLVQTTSLQSICLSQNMLSLCCGYSCKNGEESCQSQSLTETLARNTTLKQLFLDMNPLDHAFLMALWEALKNDNTTLERLGVLSTVVSNNNSTASCPRDRAEKQLHHVVALNQAGRKVARQPKAVAVLPHVLTRAARHSQPQKQLTLVQSLLRENPALWCHGRSAASF